MARQRSGSKIAIPSRLRDKLESSDILSSAVRKSLTDFEPWIDTDMPFFPDFTDHGPDHLNAVLDLCELLIPDEAWDVVSAEDAACLILAVLLHDCAMHLKIDGFRTIVDSTDPWRTVEGFGDKPWSELWADFRIEATRWPQRRVVDVLGSDKPVSLHDLQVDNPTERGRRVIGEFLRRHHARLAHEIAVNGVPGPSDESLKIEVPKSFAELGDLAGLVARSHGMSLRDCLDYAQSRYNTRRVYREVHLPYPMVLLRLADLLDLYAQRAPEQMMRVRKLQSRVSEREWQAHQSIKDIRYDTEDDPELLFLHVEPEDVHTFLRVREWLADIQREVDASWAILGEIWGRNENLTALGLRLRRVRSNLDDEVAFAKRVSFIPREAAFSAAGPELIELLVEPLYGKNPEIGMRELVQNAVDAVRELEEHCRQTGKDIDRVGRADLEADVVVTLGGDDEGGWWVQVDDRGIGMTTDTIVNYFLRAGATIQMDPAWRQEFVDDEGECRTYRCGRFGIGALASLLLGDEIEVSTRHVSARQDEGIQFVGKLHEPVIELNRKTRPIGTTIRIPIRQESRDILRERIGREDHANWDWYVLDKPSVQRKCLIPNLPRIADSQRLPYAGAANLGGWHRLQHADFEDIHWKHDVESLLVCNGIKVRSPHPLMSRNERWFAPDLGAFHFLSQIPALSVFDRRGRLPLSLTREGLNGCLPFEADLYRDVIRDFIAYLMSDGPTGPLTQRHTFREYRCGHYWGSNPSQGIWPIFSVVDGMAISEKSIVARQGLRSALMVPVESRQANVVDGISLASSAAFALTCEPRADHETEGQHAAGVIRLLTPRLHIYGRLGVILTGERLFVAEDYWKRAQAGHAPKQRMPEGDVVQCARPGWLVVEIGDCTRGEFDGSLLPPVEQAEGDASVIPALAEWLFEAGGAPARVSALAETWFDLMGDRVIPFDRQERREKLADVFKELAAYIEAQHYFEEE